MSPSTPPVPLRSLFNVAAVLSLAITSLHAAPYGPDGMAVEWTQPDGFSNKNQPGWKSQWFVMKWN